jgi:hypothetical protein
VFNPYTSIFARTKRGIWLHRLRLNLNAAVVV